MNDITFWKDETIIPHTGSPVAYGQATAASIIFQNQKNGVQGETIHHDATHKLGCPVQALARIAYYIRLHTNDITTPICTYWDAKGSAHQIYSSAINEALKLAVKQLNPANFGIDPTQLSSHSLRSGGAMALHPAGEPSHTLRKLGRWQSDAFLSSLHTQLSCFNKGLSQKWQPPTILKMSRGLPQLS